MLLETGFVVDTMAPRTEDNLTASVTMETVPVVTFSIEKSKLKSQNLDLKHYLTTTTKKFTKIGCL